MRMFLLPLPFPGLRINCASSVNPFFLSLLSLFPITGTLSGLLFQFTCSVTHSSSPVFRILMTRAIHTTWFAAAFLMVSASFPRAPAVVALPCLPSNPCLSCTFRLLPWFIQFTRLFSSIRGTPLRWHNPFFLPRLYEVPLVS
ncbi:hypothetical protein IW262DRAFT_255912 [Armillaria fumosa]|nr:hypothetical protein IW262DRAFT_255912 [Armillaria fumosa]